MVDRWGWELDTLEGEFLPQKSCLDKTPERTHAHLVSGGDVHRGQAEMHGSVLRGGGYRIGHRIAAKMVRSSDGVQLLDTTAAAHVRLEFSHTHADVTERQYTQSDTAVINNSTSKRFT